MQHLKKAGEELRNEVTAREEPKDESLTCRVVALKFPSPDKQLLNASHSFFSVLVSSAEGKKSVILLTSTSRNPSIG